MRQFTHKEFIKIVKFNGFHCDRYKGDHCIYINETGKHISVPKNIKSVIALRLIKENNLDINIKNKKRYE